MKDLMDVVCSGWSSDLYVIRLDGGQASHCRIVVSVMPAVSPVVFVFVVLRLGYSR